MKKRYLGVAALLLFALYPVTSWLMIMIDVANMGSRLVFEPNSVILHLEIGWTFFSLGFFIALILYFIIKADEG